MLNIFVRVHNHSARNKKGCWARKLNEIKKCINERINEEEELSGKFLLNRKDINQLHSGDFRLRFK